MRKGAGSDTMPRVLEGNQRAIFHASLEWWPSG